MAASSGPDIVDSGLILALDAGDRNSYSGSGTTWTDLSGQGNNGTLVNGVGYTSSNAGSLVFDGTDDYVISNTLPTFNVYCISMWIRPSSLINSSSPLKSLIQLRYRAEAGNYAWYISFGAATSLVNNEYITITNAQTGGRTCVVDGGSLSANTWHNLVFNYESTAYKIYVNTGVKSTVSSSFGNVLLLTDPNKLYLSCVDGDGGDPRGFFDGIIAQVSIYNRALTASEVQQNFNNTRARFGV